ncbi:carbohydrate ABC transporter permease [Kibdelosporangium phytohabitans]|uniref:carbohydrate ABC transporter permease n=1 Tax=Kibdelosporangium phytohabitans TaxID=860235 RepID=UPI0019F72C25|nr:hypothetical protein [Kibdelosporangium phytohabitans]MBE1464245.1 hypothetical protein [Kibdelosporangium phytohabitans]
MANVVVWGAAGFNVIVICTALRSIPAEIHQAARLDGCGEVRMALWIKVPLVRPVIGMCALFSVLVALQLVNEPFTLRPLSNAISSEWTPMMKIYKDAFVDSDVYSAPRPRSCSPRPRWSCRSSRRRPCSEVSDEEVQLPRDRPSPRCRLLPRADGVDPGRGHGITGRVVLDIDLPRSSPGCCCRRSCWSSPNTCCCPKSV